MRPLGAMIDGLSGLMNSLTGLGTSIDKGAIGDWFFTPLDDNQLECAFRQSWMAKKAIEIPAFDMIREGWTWNADADQIKALETAEKRNQLRRKVFDAMSAARLYGGAGIIISDGADNPEEPLDPERVKKGSLQFLTVLSRRYLIASELDRDPMSPGFLEPLYYTISAATGAQVRIHPSRVARFEGARVPDVLISGQTDRWSDSILDSVEHAIRDATAGQQGIAALIQEASVDVIKVPGLTSKISTADYEARLLRRFGLAAQGKSTVKALLLDAEEEYEQKTADFGGLPDVLRLLVQIVSGAADIPATRFLGQSPLGMNATGEGDLRNYYDRLAAEQELNLRPSLEKITEIMIRSELGSRPDDIDFDFSPLWQSTKKERADIGKIEAETDRIHVENATVPLPVLEGAIKARLIEGEQYPGIEAAFGDFEASGDEFDGRRAVDPDDDGDGEGEAGGGSGGGDDEGDQFADATPRSLFVQRPLLNGAELLAWARAQGFTDLIPASERHVTIAHSRTALDWIEAGQPFPEELTIGRGGPRIVEPLGDQGFKVLFFASSDLSWRHQEIKRAGAEWEFPTYQPHVSFSTGPIPDGVEAFQGELRFGPELFSELKLAV